MKKLQKLNTKNCLHGTDIGPLYICDSCVAWFPCGIPNSGAETVPDSLAGFWDPTPHNGLSCPALITGKEFILKTT